MRRASLVIRRGPQASRPAAKDPSRNSNRREGIVPNKRISTPHNATHAWVPFASPLPTLCPIGAGSHASSGPPRAVPPLRHISRMSPRPSPSAPPVRAASTSPPEGSLAAGPIVSAHRNAAHSTPAPIFLSFLSHARVCARRVCVPWLIARAACAQRVSVCSGSVESHISKTCATCSLAMPPCLQEPPQPLRTASYPLPSASATSSPSMRFTIRTRQVRNVIHTSPPHVRATRAVTQRPLW